MATASARQHPVQQAPFQTVPPPFTLMRWIARNPVPVENIQKSRSIFGPDGTHLPGLVMPRSVVRFGSRLRKSAVESYVGWLSDPSGYLRYVGRDEAGKVNHEAGPSGGPGRAERELARMDDRRRHRWADRRLGGMWHGGLAGRRLSAAGRRGGRLWKLNCWDELSPTTRRGATRDLTGRT